MPRLVPRFVLLLICLAVSPLNKAGVVLLYHHVDSRTPPITSIAPARFEEHLNVISEEGFEVVPLELLTEMSLDPDRYDPSAKRVAITFDDAYMSIYDTAFPLLKARNWPFTIFVATDLVKDDHPLYMSWAQLREMSEHGATIANHTLSHAHLVRQLAGESLEEWKVRIGREIDEAQAILKAEGFDNNLFAYPYGEYNLTLLEMVRQRGIIGYGQQSGAIGPHSDSTILPRFPLAGVYTGLAPFRNKLRSIAMPAAFYLVEPLVAEPPPTLDLVFDEGVNTAQLNCFVPGGNAVKALNGDVVSVSAERPLPVGRSRYNCTMPAPVPDAKVRYYWYSQLWMRKKDDGSWWIE